MKSLEPAGREGDGGKSAELFRRARLEGGAVGNTCGTVCGDEPQVRYLPGELLRILRLRRSVEACLYRFFMPDKSEKMEGTNYEVRKSEGFHRGHGHTVP